MRWLAAVVVVVVAACDDTVQIHRGTDSTVPAEVEFVDPDDQLVTVMLDEDGDAEVRILPGSPVRARYCYTFTPMTTQCYSEMIVGIEPGDHLSFFDNSDLVQFDDCLRTSVVLQTEPDGSVSWADPDPDSIDIRIMAHTEGILPGSRSTYVTFDGEPSVHLDGLPDQVDVIKCGLHDWNYLRSYANRILARPG